MQGSSDENLTELIQASSAGDRAAQDQLFTVVHNELRRIASRSRYVGAPGETFQATALVNEAYIELSRRMTLARLESASVRDAFYATVGRAMRTVLRDYWRTRIAEKRGGGDRAASLPEEDMVAAPAGEFDAADFLSLDEAMNRLEAFNPRWFQVVMHRYFAGREIDETAELMNISKSTVKTDWQLARAWLRREIAGGAD
jgi:RNA polymerase sigma-70 factor, ECF subfamily